MSAPILGHPIRELPYRLYTNALDEALGYALQQVQPIKVNDLKDTKTYDQLLKAYQEGKPIPKLMTSL
jgi:hypothetical protein